MKLPKSYTDELITNQDEALTSFAVNRLLRHGSFDDAFLRDLVNKIYDNMQRPRGDRQLLIGFGPGSQPLWPTTPESPRTSSPTQHVSPSPC